MSNSQSSNRMVDLLWIADNWVNAEGGTVCYEHWEKINDSLFEGWSETVKNGDTIFAEKLKILKENDEIYYVAYVKHNPAPVYFKLVEAAVNKAVFENREHDFPQKITYELNQGTLHAFIEGPGKSGKWKQIDFYFNKMR